ncbi:MAG: hypothetical protein HZB99_03725 [Candidatus Harrisonbacteria bacterium]|nr:hypothetical protein [Candidatus Harrisonbacteria bacterium]
MNFKKIFIPSALVMTIGLTSSCNQADKSPGQSDTRPSIETPTTQKPVPPATKLEDPAKNSKQEKTPKPQSQNKPAEKPTAKETPPPSVVEKPVDAPKPKENPPVIEPEPKPPVVETTPVNPPEEIVFKATPGDVTFFHAKHGTREKQCAVCHDTIFPKDKTKPLNFKGNVHQTATTNKTSCATCHMPEGKAFAVRGNCMKCHKNK